MRALARTCTVGPAIDSSTKLEPGTTVYVVVQAATGEERSENSKEIAIEVK